MKLEMQFETAFFREETICGYRVSEKQKKIWACELDLAQKFMDVCDKYNIQYIAFAGTLLGAVRHHGFIPWDDDMDFCMLRPEFEKLLAIGESEFKGPYFFQTSLTDRKYFCGYARLRNSTTTGVIQGHGEGYNNGIYIDIFVMDGYIEDQAEYEKQVRKMQNREKFLRYAESEICCSNPIKYAIRKLIQPFLANRKIYEYSYAKYQKALQINNQNTDRITFMTHNPSLRESYWMYKSDFNEIIRLPFHQLMLPAPKEYDKVLKNIYGDYMQYPPVEQRGEWHNGIIHFEPDIPYEEYFKKVKTDACNHA